MNDIIKINYFEHALLEAEKESRNSGCMRKRWKNQHFRMRIKVA
jgi:hypothetical protein